MKRLSTRRLVGLVRSLRLRSMGTYFPSNLSLTDDQSVTTMLIHVLRSLHQRQDSPILFLLYVIWLSWMCFPS